MKSSVFVRAIVLASVALLSQLPTGCGSVSGSVGVGYYYGSGWGSPWYDSGPWGRDVIIVNPPDHHFHRPDTRPMPVPHPHH